MEKEGNSVPEEERGGERGEEGGRGGEGGEDVEQGDNNGENGTTNAENTSGNADKNNNETRNQSNDMPYGGEGRAFVVLQCCLSVATFCLVLLAMLGYNTIFSGMWGGWGIVVFTNLESVGGIGYITGFASLGLTMFLMLFDAWYWEGRMRIVGYVLVGLNVSGYLVTVLLLTRDFPAGPMGLFLLTGPMFFIALKPTVFKYMSMSYYLATLVAALLVGSVGYISVWLSWLVTDDSWWNGDGKVDFYLRLRCELERPFTVPIVNVTVDKLNDDVVEMIESDPEIFDAVVEASDDLLGCTSAFLIWVAPMILSAYSFVLAVVVIYLRRKQETGSSGVDYIAKMFIAFIMLGLLGMWSAAGIAGAEMGLSTVVFTFTLLGLVISGASIATVLGMETIREESLKVPLVKRLHSALKSDWFRALLLLLIGPILLVMIPLSFLQQTFRKHVPFTKDVSGPENEEERKLWLTKPVSAQLRFVASWDRTSVSVKVVYWGIIFFSLVVLVGRVVTVFMGWLNSILTDALPATTVLFFTAGLVLFLLPPVPGVPVYLAGGVILVNAAREDFGFVGGIAYTTLVCFAIKMCAIVLQQKMIGEYCGSNSVRVKRLVGVNSVELRAVKYILMKPGLSIPKVCVLVGGPDWPTSVVSGILRLPLGQMLVGSIPVILLILPTVVGGAFLLRRGEGGFFEDATAIVLTLAFVVQAVAFSLAAYFIQEVAYRKEAEIASWELDAEVARLDEEERKRHAIYRHLTKWPRLPLVARWSLVISALLVTGSVYFFQLFSARSFVEFEVTDTIEDRLDGNVFNLFKRAGWISLSVFGAGIVFLNFYSVIARHLVRRDSDNFVFDEASESVVPRTGDKATATAAAASYSSPSSTHQPEVTGETAEADESKDYDEAYLNSHPFFSRIYTMLCPVCR